MPNHEIDPSAVHHLFEAQAERTPEADALISEQERLSYAELNDRANRLARHLRAMGVVPEALVGILAERSPEMVVGVLATLKAGGAYVPLDPGYPAERLGFMWADVGRGSPAGRPPVLLAQRRLAGALPADGGRTVFLDDGVAGHPARNLAGRAHPDSLAYVIYTSGSTGRPKGVLVPHRGVVNVIRESERLLGVGPGDRVLQLASLGFDASVLEIFTALATGACLVLTRRETLMSGEALGRELRDRSITAMAIPPSLLDTVPDLDLPCLRSIIVGGEACSAATAARWAVGRRLVNAYAPTEATIYATAALLTGDGAAAPPIGRPIPGIEVRLLDPDGDPVAAGEAGELCLGGVGVVRGYLNRPELTAERFVPDGAGAPGARLYRSGDLARAFPDGNLQFVGRVDTQVKVRGYRIELGEIEAVLGGHPGVQTCAVAALEDEAAGGKRLVAYVVRRRGENGPEGVGVPELREILGRRLPDYMVPSAFVFLEAMPMTPTGKVDRRALPAPGRERPDLGSEFIAPATPLEAALARVWGELLGIDQVGVRDNLFELGGHSLVAAQIVTRVREDLGIELPLRDVFERPTVADLAERLAVLVDSAGGEARAGDAGRLPPLERAPRDQPLPLSFAQERIWFLNQLAPGSIAYNFQFTIRFTGALDPEALRRGLAELVRRHEVLRTSFPSVDGRPVQVIHEPWPVELPLVDLSGMSPKEREAAAERLVREETRKGFDVTLIPLLRWRLLRLGERDHLLVQVEHHFVHDGWSLAVFLRELKELYAAFRDGLSSPLPEPAVQYADFAVWQRRWMRGEVLRGQLDYWKERLGGSPPPLELPADRPRPRAHSFRGGALRVDLPPRLYADLRAFSRREGSTLFMTMLAAFYALLYRYTGREDILLGSGIANRRLRETESMVGMVVNTLVFRTALSGDLTFRELLSRVRDTTLGAHDHQDMPFEKIVEELQPDRDLSRNPMFQTLFSFHDAPVPDLDLPGLSGYLFERHNGSAKSDLNVVVKPLAEQRVGRRTSAEEELLTMVWEYSADLFEAATIGRMWGHYQTLLAGIVEGGAGQRVSELPLLTGAERGRLAEWNRTEAPVPAGRLAHQLFAEQARRAPGALAVAAGEERLTYGEVDRRASALARRLRSLGLRPEGVVAVLTERSPEMVVGALGTLKAGGAYLPLDPAYPPDRLAFMLEDSGAVALLTRSALRDAVPAMSVASLPVLELDSPAGEDEAGGAEEADGLGDDRLAYVIYTSGSTGRPKGVEVSHAGLVNLVAWHRRTYGVAAEDRATLLAGPAFDASVWELWPCLAAGASVHIPDAETRAAPQRLLAWLAAERITVCFLPTPLAEAVLDLEPPPDLALRFLLTGGDRLRRAPDGDSPCVLVNHYGPTENTVVTTAAPVPPAAPGPPPIGRPIANTRVHLVDRDLRRVPAGVPGELLAAGTGLARGYHGRPDLTAERFVPDPWSGQPGGRLYRTGDLARYLPDGEIEFLGRIDHQVKIRGYRIELGEIEAVLAGHPAVREAVVVAHPGAAGASLAAYVVPVAPAGEALATEALRAFLAAKLPDYMVPAVFVKLSALPLTPNGKVDLRALPEPELREEDEAGGRLAPRTPFEELLAGIWAEVIGVAEVGPRDNFFKLGGHSLLATRVLSRVYDAVRAEVPLADFFEGPTVAELARAVEEALRGSSAFPASLRIPRRSREGPASLSFAQERLWFLDQLSPGVSVYNIARAFRLLGRLDATALARAAGEIVRRHEALRTTFPAATAGPVQEIARELPVRPPVIDLSGCAGAIREAETGRLLQREARRPFDLQGGPLLRLLLLRTGPEEHTLVLAMHHIVSDGWSMDVFFRELSRLYRAFAGGGSARLPELPVQYADFAVWQRERLRGETLAELLEYWKGQLAGAPALLELATDQPRPLLQSFRGAQETTALAAETTRALRELARRAGVTPFMLLVAALAAFFGRLTGQRDVVLGSPIASRNRSEIEGLIGFFVNTLALRTRWDGDPAFRELLEGARRVTLAAHAHQELPFEKLVAELAPERSLGRTPLFQVMLAFQNTGGDGLDLPGLEVEPVEVRRDESRFDLELTAVDSGEGLAILWRYDGDLFDRATVVRLAGQLEILLRGLLADPGSRLSELPVISEAEAQQLLIQGRGLRSDYPRELTIHDLFSAQARATPDAPAVEEGGERLTYRALNERANRLAHYLRSLGVGPDVRVGLGLNRSLEAVVAILAILKAGGAYVPLDPSYPEERLSFMLEEAAAPVLLTLTRHAAALPAGHRGMRTVVLDQERERIERWSAEDPVSGADPESLAYVIYTSGSTGRPKGVAVCHRGVVRLVRSTDFAELTAAESWLQVGSIAFDVSTLEIWGGLLNGGRLVVLPSYTPSYQELGEAIERNAITSFWLTAGLFHQMVAEGDLESLRGVRQLLAGGDVLSPRHVEKVLSQLPDLTLINGYGPTENTTFTCCHRMRGPQRFSGSVPIGRPIANTRVALLDADLRLTPMGAVGELCAGGDGVARGYLGRPDLTAEKFIPDPAGEEPGARLYRTGDLARWLPGGILEFLGRMDGQVKLRGFRIELGEVEASLLSHPGVREAVVLARDDGPAGRRLVAYVVPAQEEPSPADLRDHLQRRLPDYMIPSAVVTLEALPLNPSGKVDRRALPAPDGARPEGVFVAPESPEEKSLAAIWSEVLGVEKVGVHDDFFHLGGHSLLAAQVVARVRRDFQVDLPLRSLFQAPTVSGLLGTVRQARESADVSNVPSIPKIQKIARAPRTAGRRAPAGEGGGR